MSVMKELEDLKALCDKNGLKTEILDNKGKKFLTDEFGFCFVHSLGNNFYEILGDELVYDEKEGILTNFVKSGDVYLTTAYDFMDSLIKDNLETENKI